MDSDQQEIILDFVSESREVLDRTEPMLIELMSGMDAEKQKGYINSIFGLFHTLKGTAGFLNLNHVKEYTHALENLLQCYRKDISGLHASHINVLNQGCDLIRQILGQVEQQFSDEGFEAAINTSTVAIEQCIAEASGVAVTQSPKSQPPSSASRPQPQAPQSQGPQLTKEDFEYTIADEFKSTFVEESEEQLNQTEDVLLVLDKLPGDLNTGSYIDTAFRNMHTLKGNAGFLNINAIVKLAHLTEALLEQLKEGVLSLTPKMTQALLQAMDTFKQGIRQVSKESPLEPEAFFRSFKTLETFLATPRQESNRPQLGELLIEMGMASSEAVDRALERQQMPLGQILEAMGEVEPGAIKKALDAQKTQSSRELISPLPPKTTKAANSPVRKQDIRVGLDKIDQLINLVGELVISEAMVSHNPELEGLELESFRNATMQLKKNVRDLQETAMSMRMVPVSATFRKMIRVVHDVASKVGKHVDLELYGEDTEIDKTVVEQIADPLLHIIRNAVDHGIDTPEERQKAGKPEIGKIKLTAKHAGNEVWIIIQDDGRGLNRAKILERAKQRGLLSPEVDPADEDVWRLVFEPGFSTVEKVTDLSGRGVGMDVVKRNIEQLNGRIEIASSSGKGSTFTLRIPLTLAIIDGMVVRVGKSFYVIPIVSIRESFQPRKEDIIRTSEGQELVKIRDEILAVVNLYEVHQRKPDTQTLWEGILVIIEEEDQQLCLFLDEVIGEMQVVVKALPKSLGKVAHLSGCTIMGNGGISLILDVASLLRAHL
ncbi:chemotaxis protein CheA [Deltaproteobacteria bacterium TL4]